MATCPVLIVFLSAVVSYQEPAKTSGWTAFAPPEGDFKIEFPARPLEQSKAIPSAVGTIQQRVYYARSGGCLFTVQRFRYQRPFPILELADRLTEQKRGYLQGRVELVRENDVTVDDVTGQQFEYKAPSPRANGTVTSLTRHFIKGSSYYAMTVMSSPNQALPPEADRFLDSFHFTTREPAKAAAAPKTGAEKPKDQPGAMAKAPAAGARPAIPDATPDEALRTFMVAVARQDEPVLRAVTLPDPELDWLLRGPAAPPEVVERMRAIAAEIKLRRLKAGDEIKLPQGKAAVVPPAEADEDHAVILPEGSQAPIRLRRIDGHWKVDARPIIAARKAAAAAQQKGRGR